MDLYAATAAATGKTYSPEDGRTWATDDQIDTVDAAYMAVYEEGFAPDDWHAEAQTALAAAALAGASTVDDLLTAVGVALSPTPEELAGGTARAF